MFALKSFSDSFKRWLTGRSKVRLHEVDDAQEICKDVYTTGGLRWPIKGQSLVVRTDDGLTVINGCAHPGLESVLRVASKLREIYGVIGGFHGFSKLEALKGVSLIVSCHCTMRKKELFDHDVKTEEII